MIEIQNFIGGEFKPAMAARFMDVYDPARGAVYAKAPDSEAIDVVQAIQAANKAFLAWSELAPAKRAEYLNNIADLIEENKLALAEAESRDMGKPLWLALESDLPRTILNFRYFAALVNGDQTLSKKFDNRALEYVRREPLGVTGLISPWNMPLYTLTYKIAPSLAVGNVAVCKPSELSPMTAFELAKIMQKAKLPPGVCNFIFGRGETAGATLVSHPGVPLISFTGGTETAEKIQKVAGPMMKRLSLELGGKNANLIFKDADLKNAVKGAIRASFLNSGQICLCGSRLLVQEDIYKEFMVEFKKAASEIVIGDPHDKNTFMGPLVSREHREKVMAAIEQARKEEGKVTLGGRVPTNLPATLADGYFLEPTIIEDLTNCSELWQREIFGPVVTVMTFKYPHDAVKWANTSSYGLSASLWTQDISRAHKIAAQIKAGTVWINTWGLRDVAVPFGGFKLSGIGREGGEDSLRTYSESKTVCLALS